MGKLRIYSPNSNVIGSATLNVAANKIIAIELLQGDKELTAAEVIQYVNLKRDIKYVDGVDVKDIDRLGRALKLKVTFENEANVGFRVELRPESGNVAYTSTEKARNSNFGYTTSRWFYKADLPNVTNSVSLPPEKDVIAYVGIDSNHNIKEDILVTPAGGDVFTIVAVDQFGNEVKAKSKVKTQRIMYYVEAKMKGLSSSLSAMSIFENEYDKHDIKLEKQSEILEITQRGNIDNSVIDSIKAEVSKKYNTSLAKSKNPYCIAVTFVEYLADKEKIELKKRITIDGTSTTTKINLPSGKYLWNNNIDGTKWFIECYFDQTYIFGLFGDKTKMNGDLCTPTGEVKSGWYNAVDIDISKLPKGSGEIILKVNILNGMSGGISFRDTNVVFVATKAWDGAKDETKQSCVMIHEVGHQLNMACDGSDDLKLPDKVSTFYTEKGHLGRHCNSGLSTSEKGKKVYGSAESKKSTCVMFGATNGRTTFCINCAQALKKVDLANGVKYG